MKYKVHAVAALFPMMAAPEIQELAQDITEHGQQQPIIVHGEWMLDGRNRLAACDLAKIAPKIEEYSGSEDEITSYIVAANIHRRHLDLSQRAALAVELEPIYTAAAQKRMVAGVKLDPVAFLPQGGARDLAAKSAKVSSRLVGDAKSIKKSDPAKFDKIKAGTLTVGRAKAEAKKEAQKIAVVAIQQKIEAEAKIIKPENRKYDVVIIDPPWDYSDVGGTKTEDYEPNTNRGTTPYPTLRLEEIKKLKFPLKADATVFLWITPAFVPKITELLAAWGLTYRSIIAWNKVRMGLGRFLRHQMEYVVVARIGEPQYKPTQSVRDYIAEQGREHSRKPDAFYRLVDDLCIGSKLDYFAREKRAGYDVHGIESDKFNTENMENKEAK